MDQFDLQRFVEAQSQVYGAVLSELRHGRKVGHWMWFVFPQMDGLGSSWMSRKYSVKSLEEAVEYLAHPLLGVRIRECTELVNKVKGRSVEMIFGTIDAMKFRSSMTLFAIAESRSDVFDMALRKYFDSRRDELTLRLIASQGN